MLDPAVSLAFNLQANPGAYALLLGSGLSRSASVPTGWEIVQDLVRRYATLAKEDCGADPAAWYTRKFGADPDYSKLLNDLGGTASERNQILRGYFEPSEDERERGLKTPTAAHHAIARIVVGGYIRVIVTTNFDQLLETALETAGIVPTIISSEDQALGATPPQLNKCTILKVNGDYLDSRIRNTSEELANYGANITALLDRIFDEFGLIVCGWSGDWDAGLRAALERSRSRRFTTFWAADLTAAGRRLVEHLRGTVITIKDADSFFVDLADKVQSVADLNAPHPLTPAMAVATLKRLLPDPLQAIRLADLVSRETETLVRACAVSEFPKYGEVTGAAITRRLEKYEAVTSTMLHLVSAGIYFGKRDHDRLWVRAIQRIGTPQGEWTGLKVLLNLGGYPATILLYAGGIAAVAAERFTTLAELVSKTIVRAADEHERPFILTGGFLERDFGKLLPGRERHHTPASDHLHDLLREPLRRYVPDDEEYEKLFDRFEALAAVIYAYVRKDRRYFPFGRFCWRNGRGGWTVRDELKDAAAYWDRMREGLPPGSEDEFVKAATFVRENGVIAW